MSSEQTAIKTTYFSIASNTVLALVKGLAGIFGNSYALIADAIESTTDIFTSLLVLLGFKYAKRPADDNHPYGHGRIEPLITFGVVAFLVIAATIIAYESIKNIQTPQETPKSWTLMVLAVIIIWKEISYRIVIQKSKQISSTSLKADAWHHRSDAITSIMAFIGIAIAIIFGKGYENADDWAALVSAAFILYNSYLIVRPALGEVMDEQVYEDFINDIRMYTMNVPGVLKTEKCFVRKSGMMFHVDLHVVVDAEITVKEGHDVAHEVTDYLRQKLPQVNHVLIHIEPHVKNH